MTTQQILNLKFYSHDLQEYISVNEYLLKIINLLFSDFELFDVKRPLGNSNWEDDLAICFIENNIIDGKCEYLENRDDIHLVNHLEYNRKDLSNIIIDIFKSVFHFYMFSKFYTNTKYPEGYSFDIGM